MAVSRSQCHLLASLSPSAMTRARWFLGTSRAMFLIAFSSCSLTVPGAA